jgi:hypothetical protein
VDAQARAADALAAACDIFETEVGRPLLCAMTTVATGVSVGAATCTPAKMYGIAVGQTLWCENADGTNGEVVLITAVTASTFTGTFTLAKAANWTARTEYTELISGDGSPILLPYNWPIITVRNLQVVDDTWNVLDSAAGVMGDFSQFQAYIPPHRLWLEARGGTYLSFSTGYGINPQLRGALWPDGVGNILISYSSGYLGALPSPAPTGWYRLLPPKIKTAVAAITHLILNEKSWIGLGAKMAGGNMESIQQIVRKFDAYPVIDEVLNHERRRGT